MIEHVQGSGPVKVPVAFADLPESSFPVLVEFFTMTSGHVVHRLEFDGPGVLQIPGLSALWGPVGCRVITADGGVHEATP